MFERFVFSRCAALRMIDASSAILRNGRIALAENGGGIHSIEEAVGCIAILAH